MKRPRCKCGKPAEFYGPIGGYSKACVDCNKANAKRQRIARAKNKPKPFWYPNFFAA